MSWFEWLARPWIRSGPPYCTNLVFTLSYMSSLNSSSIESSLLVALIMTIRSAASVNRGLHSPSHIAYTKSSECSTYTLSKLLYELVIIKLHSVHIDSPLIDTVSDLDVSNTFSTSPSVCKKTATWLVVPLHTFDRHHRIDFISSWLVYWFWSAFRSFGSMPTYIALSTIAVSSEMNIVDRHLTVKFLVSELASSRRPTRCSIRESVDHSSISCFL